MGRRQICCAVTAVAGALVSATPAAADPWDGGRDAVTAFEAQATAIASEIAERPVSVYCNSPEEWAVLATQSQFEGQATWGYVTFTLTPDGWQPGDEAQLSDQACRHADAFWLGGSASKPARTCRVGTTIERRTVTRVRKGKRVRVRVRKVVPVTGFCPSYLEGRVFAIQTLAHEAVHLAGVEDEAVAECYGVQYFAWVASRLGAPDALARQMAADYWSEYYVEKRPGTPYFDAECRDGGVLDLTPDREGWPTPDPVRGTASVAPGR